MTRNVNVKPCEAASRVQEMKLLVAPLACMELYKQEKKILSNLNEMVSSTELNKYLQKKNYLNILMAKTS